MSEHHAVKQSPALSGQQESILLYLFHSHQEAGWGVRWRVAGDASRRASFSRSVARLESLGLVRRRNQRSGDQWIPVMSQECAEQFASVFRKPVQTLLQEDAASQRHHHGRATHIQLTDDGEELCRRLTKRTAVFVNHETEVAQ